MPSHYEERLQKDLTWIQDLVGIVGNSIGQALDNAVKAVLTLNKDVGAEVVIGDYTINRQTRELDRLCHVFVARHLPSAGHLRYVSSVMRLGIALERIGDYAATISRTAAQLSTVPPSVVARDIEMMAEHARRSLAEALRAFRKKDASLAQATLASASQFTQYFDKVFADLVTEGEAHSRPVNDLFSLMATFNRLERVIHQAKNICEETMFAVTGRTKGEKQFQILFVDAKNSGASQIAEHFTRKAFPQSGRYRSAGWDAAEEVDRTYVEFARTVGLDLTESWPTPLASLKEQFAEYQLVVGLGQGAREKIGPMPFHTTVLNWDLDPAAGPEAAYRQISPRVRDLMERLRGEQAS
ncbi:MAG: PhoU domain-containing protein [Planctomycetota bacterium]